MLSRIRGVTDRQGQIAAHPDDVEAALAEYEQALFPRSAAEATEATEATRDFELCYDDNAPQGHPRA